MIENPTKWPFAVLPLKQKQNGMTPRLGYLNSPGVAWGAHPKRTVHIGLMFNDADETVNYDNVDDLLDAGWAVD